MSFIKNSKASFYAQSILNEPSSKKMTDSNKAVFKKILQNSQKSE